MGLLSFFLKKYLERSVDDDKAEAPRKLRSAYAIRTETPKANNQDAFKVFHDNESDTIIMAIADGIGSSRFAEDGSRYVVEKSIELLKDTIQYGNKIDFVDIFNRIESGLTKMVEENYSDHLDDINSHDFGTTLIVGVDSPEIFTLAYIGNGCAYCIQGDVTCFPNLNYMPWIVKDLLIPHSLPNSVNGKDELCRYFSYRPTNVNQTVPTVVTITKNHQAGEILVLATDGLDSADKHDEFYYQDDELYTKSSWNMSLLCSAVKEYLKTTPKVDDDGLSKLLSDFINTLDNDKRIDDDITIGIIVTPNANCQSQ